MKRIFILSCLALLVMTSSLFADKKYIGTYVYAISEKDTKIFRSTEEIFKILDNQVGLVYADTTGLIRGIEAALSEYPESLPYIKSAIRDTLKMPSLLQDSLCAEETGFICQVSSIHLDSQSVDLLKNRLVASGHFQKLSSPVLKFLDNLTGVSFPDSALFHRYAISLLVASMGLCATEVDSAGGIAWTDSEFNSAMALWKNHRVNTNYFIKERNFHRTCSDKKRQLVQSKVDSVYSKTWRTRIAPILQKYYAFDTIAPVWNGDDCGCVQKEELEGEVYGFFPYWSAYSGDRTLDFSAVTRIAYYGISADKSGRLRFPATLETPLNFFAKAKNIQFVNNAHKHNVRVDWTIEKDQWDASPALLKLVLDTLSNEIIQLITPKLPSTFHTFFSQFTYSADEMNSRGDGVTLYFKNYPKDSVSTRLFNHFFLTLREKLKSYGDYFFVNMLMSHPDLIQDSGIYSFKNFRKLLNIVNVDSNGLSKEEIRMGLRSFLLVIMDEPLLRTKREIYSELDEKLRGDDHRILMQSLTPVIWFDNMQWDELKDDFDFYADAFYNIGIAPYAASANPRIDNCIEMGSLASCILRNFEIAGASHERQTFFAGFVCTHRWLFRILHAGICCVSLILLLGGFFICRFRAFIGRKLPLFLAVLLTPPISLSLLLVVYDPALISLLQGNYPIVLSALFVFLVTIGLVLFFTYDRDLPMRRDE